MTNKGKCSGVVVPMITPLNDREEIDQKAAKRITEYLIQNGCIPFILGTSGEATSQSAEQKLILSETVVEAADNRVPIYAGISSTCFSETVQLANTFFKNGVDYVVAHLPFFYPLTSVQMKEYFMRLADAIRGPLMAYNIPSTTGMAIPTEVIFELSEHKNIVGIKDSERSIEKHMEIIEFCRVHDRFAHFSGWGVQIARALLSGSDGLVPSTGNLVPGIYYELYKTALAGEEEKALQIQAHTDAISAVYQKDRTLGESLAALKIMMHQWGLCGKTMQSPLTPLDPGEESKVIEQMMKLDLTSVETINDQKER